MTTLTHPPLPYRQWPAVNWSTLKLLGDSAAHYRHGLEHVRPDSPALALGRAAHVLTFEPELFDDNFAVWEGRRAGGAWVTFQADNVERTILKTAEVELAQNIARAARGHEFVQRYLEDGRFEVPLMWMDEATQIPCKAQLDWVCERHHAILDLKTCQSTKHRRFASAAARYGYPGQLAHYSAGVEAVYGWQPKFVGILAVESSPPHDTVLYILERDGAMYAGEELRNGLMAQLKECFDTDEWPGRYPGPQTLELPEWAFPDTAEAGERDE